MTAQDVREKQREARYETQDKVKAADEELKKAIAERIKSGNALAIEELRYLATWVPECGFPYETELGSDEPIPADEKRRLDTAPFVSEAFLYALLGKEDARTFLALFNSICRSLGVDDYWELQAPWFRAIRADKEESVAYLKEQSEALSKAGHTLAKDGKRCQRCFEVQSKRKSDYKDKDGCIRARILENLERATQALRDCPDEDDEDSDEEVE